jgi:hypothetical protein
MGRFDNKKSLRFVITLENSGASFTQTSDTVNDSGNLTQTNLGNQITLEGFRATCDVDKAGGIQMNTCRAVIYGVGQSDMNTLTSLQWQPGTLKHNQIVVFAVDGEQETQIFTGNIGNCWANYGAMPDVYLEVQAFAGLINQLTPVPPTSFRGPVDVATKMSQLAQQMGYTFQNNLLDSITLNYPCLSGLTMGAGAVFQRSGRYRPLS